MFRIETITKQSKDIIKINKLYSSAFPANERRPLTPLLCDDSQDSNFIAFYDDDTFCGFACLLNYLDIRKKKPL